MKTVKELVDLINAAKLNTPHNVEDEIDMKAEGITKVSTVDEEEHRWYLIGTVVFKTGSGGLFGVRGPVKLYSESSTWGDIGDECTAFEMEEVPSVTYKAK